MIFRISKDQLSSSGSDFRKSRRAVDAILRILRSGSPFPQRHTTHRQIITTHKVACQWKITSTFLTFGWYSRESLVHEEDELRATRIDQRPHLRPKCCRSARTIAFDSDVLSLILLGDSKTLNRLFSIPPSEQVVSAVD